MPDPSCVHGVSWRCPVFLSLPDAYHAAVATIYASQRTMSIPVVPHPDRLRGVPPVLPVHAQRAAAGVPTQHGHRRPEGHIRRRAAARAQRVHLPDVRAAAVQRDRLHELPGHCAGEGGDRVEACGSSCRFIGEYVWRWEVLFGRCLGWPATRWWVGRDIAQGVGKVGRYNPWCAGCDRVGCWDVMRHVRGWTTGTAAEAP